MAVLNQYGNKINLISLIIIDLKIYLLYHYLYIIQQYTKKDLRFEGSGTFASIVLSFLRVLLYYPKKFFPDKISLHFNKRNSYAYKINQYDLDCCQ